MITSGHLCSGYDGLGRGLGLLRPHRALWHAESDPDMAITLAKHEPDVRNVGDLTTASWHDAPVPDVVTAGIPCQPISRLGAGRGEGDERYLWPYALGIFREVRPAFILLENVERLTSKRMRDGSLMLDRWLFDLRALGYAARWTVIGACAVGAPHHRHRFYAWARLVGAGAPEAVRVHTPCGAPRNGGRILLPTPTTSDTNGPGRATKTGGDDLRTVVSLLPTPMAADAERATAWVGRRDNPTLIGAVRPDRWGEYAEAVATWEAIIGRPAPEPTEPNSKGGRRLSPLLPEWMMGLPDGYLTGHLSRAAAIKAAGNGAVPLQAAAAQKLLAGAA